jgi:hypothetical protein
MKARTCAHVAKAVGCPYLELVKGYGYLYFVYDRPELNVWETYSVPVCYLNHLSLEEWVRIGAAFVAKMEQGMICTQRQSQ